VWIKIADFGLTKRVEDELGITNTLKGTMGFIAPELHGFTARTTDYATDIWALGEIAFQMVTKQPTFRNLAVLFQYVQGIEAFPDGILRERSIGNQAIEFVRSTMSPLPTSRPTADEGLVHPWILSFAPEHPTPELPEGDSRRLSNESDRSFEASGVWTVISDASIPESKTVEDDAVSTSVLASTSLSAAKKVMPDESTPKPAGFDAGALRLPRQIPQVSRQSKTTARPQYSPSVLQGQIAPNATQVRPATPAIIVQSDHSRDRPNQPTISAEYGRKASAPETTDVMGAQIMFPAPVSSETSEHSPEILLATGKIRGYGHSAAVGLAAHSDSKTNGLMNSEESRPPIDLETSAPYEELEKKALWVKARRAQSSKLALQDGAPQPDFDAAFTSPSRIRPPIDRAKPSALAALRQQRGVDNRRPNALKLLQEQSGVGHDRFEEGSPRNNLNNDLLSDDDHPSKVDSIRQLEGATPRLPKKNKVPSNLDYLNDNLLSDGDQPKALKIPWRQEVVNLSRPETKTPTNLHYLSDNLLSDESSEVSPEKERSYGEDNPHSDPDAMVIWNDFCQTCDRQTSDGHMFCSEACRLAHVATPAALHDNTSSLSSWHVHSRNTSNTMSPKPMPRRLPTSSDPEPQGFSRQTFADLNENLGMTRTTSSKRHGMQAVSASSAGTRNTSALVSRLNSKNTRDDTRELDTLASTIKDPSGLLGRATSGQPLSNGLEEATTPRDVESAFVLVKDSAARHSAAASPPRTVTDSTSVPQDNREGHSPAPLIDFNTSSEHRRVLLASVDADLAGQGYVVPRPASASEHIPNRSQTAPNHDLQIEAEADSASTKLVEMMKYGTNAGLRLKKHGRMATPGEIRHENNSKPPPGSAVAASLPPTNVGQNRSNESDNTVTEMRYKPTSKAGRWLGSMRRLGRKRPTKRDPPKDPPAVYLYDPVGMEMIIEEGVSKGPAS
jgi:hypothetical protein